MHTKEVFVVIGRVHIFLNLEKKQQHKKIHRMLTKRSSEAGRCIYCESVAVQRCASEKGR